MCYIRNRRNKKRVEDHFDRSFELKMELEKVGK